MPRLNGRMALRLCSTLVAAWLAACCMAQGKFVINGRLKVEGGGLDGCRMVVYKNGEKHRTITSDLQRFSLELELNESFILSFEKPGFVTKKLSFNTRVPATADPTGFRPFEFVVALFKQYDGLNTVVFNQPVGMIRYDAALGDLDYDTDYTKSIQSALQAAQQEVEAKQKEEAGREAEAAKQREREAKEKAKEEARAAKEAKEREKKEPVAAVAPPKPPPAPATPPPPPAEQPKAEPRMAPPPKPARTATIPAPRELTEPRKGSAPRMMEEPSRVQPALAHSMEEPRPKFEPTPAPVIRHQDVIVRPNEVITVIKLEEGERVTEYRRVARKYSGIYFFKNGVSCTQLTYEQEALAEN